jgi:PAS domain S-box-containing protein
VSVCLDVSQRQRAEDAVRARERQLVEILESVHDSFVALDRDWRITYVNRRAASSVDAEPDSFIGKQLFEQFPGYIGTPIEAAARRAMEGREPVAEEVFSPVTNRWLEVNFNPTSEGMSIFARDVSERKRAALAIARQSEQARAVAVAFTRIASERRLDDKLRLIVDNVREVVSANRAVITLREGGNSLHAASMASQAAGYEPPSSAQLTWETEQLEKVLREDRIHSITTHDLAAHDAEGSQGGFLGAPLRGRDGAIYGGIHLLDKVEGDFSEDDEAILTQFAQFASNAIEAVCAESAQI